MGNLFPGSRPQKQKEFKELKEKEPAPDENTVIEVKAPAEKKEETEDVDVYQQVSREKRFAHIWGSDDIFW